MKFKFEDIKFKEEKDSVRAFFLNTFYFDIPNNEISKIGKFYVENNILHIDASEKKAKRFQQLLDQGFSRLTNMFNEKRTIYVHQNSGIPLIGNVAFGIIDRNTNIIEIKPITSCNLDCIYCSVSDKRRERDFIVEADYLVAEVNKIIEYKGFDDFEIHIGCQGEPLRYAKLSYLIHKLRENGAIKRVSMDTNGTMLSESKVDELIEAGLTRFNISLNAIDPEIGENMAGKTYFTENILKIIEYIAKQDVELIVAPVWVPKINDEEIEKIVAFVVGLNKKQKAPLIGIQKYLKYKYGNTLKEMEWQDFYDYLKKLERKYDTKLVLNAEMFDIKETKPLPKPFRKNDVVDVEAVYEGRMPNEKIAVAKGRTISFVGKERKRLKITRIKHNIYYGA